MYNFFKYYFFHNFPDICNKNYHKYIIIFLCYINLIIYKS